MKRDFGPFHWLRIGDWSILARTKKGILLAHQVTGMRTSWIEIGGLRIWPDKKAGRMLASPGVFTINLEAVQEESITTDPLMHSWFIAGAKIGESFCSYDKQPKISGPRKVPILVRRIKRRADFLEAVELWHSWLKWRQSGAQEKFEVFYLGPLQKYTDGKKRVDADAAERIYKANCKAITQRVQGDYGLSLDRDFQSATLKARKHLGS